MTSNAELSLSRCNLMLDNPESTSVKSFFNELPNIPRFESTEADDPAHLGLKLFSACFQTLGIMSMGKLLELDKLTAQQLAAKSRCDAWVDTLTDMDELPLLVWVDLEAPSATAQAANAAHPWRATGFLSPEKVLTCLGEELRRSGRIDELTKFFSNPGVFVELLVARPQIIALRSPMDACESRIAFTIIFVCLASRWGSVNICKLAARMVIKGLHTIPMLLPAHGKVASIDRKGWQVVTRRAESGRRLRGCAPPHPLSSHKTRPRTQPR